MKTKYLFSTFLAVAAISAFPFSLSSSCSKDKQLKEYADSIEFKLKNFDPNKTYTSNELSALSFNNFDISLNGNYKGGAIEAEFDNNLKVEYDPVAKKIKVSFTLIEKKTNKKINCYFYLNQSIKIEGVPEEPIDPENPHNPGGPGNPSTPIVVGNIVYDSSNKYYASLENKSGKELYDAIFKLQKSHTGGIGSYADLYQAYKTAFLDKYFEKNNSVLDVYSENPNGNDPYEFKHGEWDGAGGHPRPGGQANAEGWMYNREHVIPQSWFNKETPTKHDPHFVWPTDKKVNEWRGNKPHYYVSNGSVTTSLNGTKWNNNYCEPIDYFKGDIARAYFYFQATHRNGMSKGGDTVFSSAFPYFNNNFLTCYLDWVKKDPVDIIEIDRNNAIAEFTSGLRNPFIDYPDLPELIFGNSGKTFSNKGVAVGVQ
ncbi:endonuclease [Mycoplasmopsis hyopharyngis]|uniref:endonuclease n=1 Tax=Mycoplasmopsis hyopharyngis TaxID=29558 RepID=UPI003872B3C7